MMYTTARINETALGLMEGPETDEDDVELDFEEVRAK